MNTLSIYTLDKRYRQRIMLALFASLFLIFTITIPVYADYFAEIGAGYKSIGTGVYSTFTIGGALNSYLSIQDMILHPIAIEANNTARNFFPVLGIIGIIWVCLKFIARSENQSAGDAFSNMITIVVLVAIGLALIAAMVGIFNTP